MYELRCQILVSSHKKRYKSGGTSTVSHTFYYFGGLLSASGYLLMKKRSNSYEILQTYWHNADLGYTLQCTKQYLVKQISTIYIMLASNFKRIKNYYNVKRYHLLGWSGKVPFFLQNKANKYMNSLLVASRHLLRRQWLRPLDIHVLC